MKNQPNCINGLISRAKQLKMVFLFMLCNGLVSSDDCQFDGHTFADRLSHTCHTKLQPLDWPASKPSIQLRTASWLLTKTTSWLSYWAHLESALPIHWQLQTFWCQRMQGNRLDIFFRIRTLANFQNLLSKDFLVNSSNFCGFTKKIKIEERRLFFSLTINCMNTLSNTLQTEQPEIVFLICRRARRQRSQSPILVTVRIDKHFKLCIDWSLSGKRSSLRQFHSRLFLAK